MSNKFFVTGANGYIGKYLINFLRKKNLMSMDAIKMELTEQDL